MKVPSFKEFNTIKSLIEENEDDNQSTTKNDGRGVK